MSPLFLKLEAVKTWLRLETDYMDEDEQIKLLMLAAETYVMSAIDNFEANKDDPHYLAAASLICYMLIVDWYERRDFSGGVNEKQRYTIQSLLLQLQTKPTVSLKG